MSRFDIYRKGRPLIVEPADFILDPEEHKQILQLVDKIENGIDIEKLPEVVGRIRALRILLEVLHRFGESDQAGKGGGG